MKTTLDRQAEAMERQMYTNYGQGVIQGHYTSKKAAGYLKTHTRCTKGHGWTAKGEFGGCAQCEEQ